MENILEVKNLTKRYSNFTLNNVSFSIPRGSIMGFIGENGSGKSTTINAILNLIQTDGGTVSLLGSTADTIDKDTLEDIGVVFDGNSFPVGFTPKKLNKVLSRIYTTWDEELFFSYINKMNLPLNKKIKEFSKGMKMKLSIISALSHHPKLLILDEATSGLDPIIREDILDIFLDFIQDENNGILVSSHITSDLEKVADYITFIHDGQIVFSKSKDEIIYNYGILKCTSSSFDKIDKNDIIAYRQQDYGYQILVEDKDMARRKYADFVVDDATIDEVMLIHVKGEN